VELIDTETRSDVLTSRFLRNFWKKNRT